MEEARMSQWNRGIKTVKAGVSMSWIHGPRRRVRQPKAMKPAPIMVQGNVSDEFIARMAAAGIRLIRVYDATTA
jgi:hypothetical protein